MQTEVYVVTKENQEAIFQKAAAVIHHGGLVAMPTETVYGLGADGLNANAVKKIYTAKGRPSDNPLILHISSFSELTPLVKSVGLHAKILMEHFWPGPLTLVFPKSDIIPAVVSGGLDTVAVRMPENDIARGFISYCHTPIAAPSANSSGRPSPTKAEHVLEDLNGKIDMILDGGSCDIGLESTVVDVTGDFPVILRPGKISIEDIRALIPTVVYDRHLTTGGETAKPKSPGMKYKHYAPKGQIYVLDGQIASVKSYIASHITKDCAILTFDEFPMAFANSFSLGSMQKPEEGANRLFDLLRHFDALEIKTIFALTPPNDGIGFALCNRLFKAAGGKILHV